MKLNIPPNYGITRIDIDKKKRGTHGYEVRIRKRNKNIHKLFSDSLHGGKRKALEAARKFRDKTLVENPPLTRAEFSNIKRGKLNTESDIVGVTLAKSVDKRKKKTYTYYYWQAWWSPKVGVRKTKRFSINLYGYEKAFEMAKKARENGLKEMQDYDTSFISLSKKRKKQL